MNTSSLLKSVFALSVRRKKHRRFELSIACAGPRPPWVNLDAAIRGRSLALGLAEDHPADHRNRNHLTVLVAFHNPGHFLDDCVESLMSQDHDRFNIVFIDDASTDGSSAALPMADPRVRVVKNATRQYAARNVHDTVVRLDEDEIVVVVDGDDRLSESDALSWIDAEYQKYDCWLTFGQFRYSHGVYGFAAPYADPAEFAQHRHLRWRATHLRTFRAGLYHRLADQDPTYSCIRDHQGNWRRSAADIALMMPLLDAAGFEKSRFCDRCLYVYNVENPNSWHHVDPQTQARNYRDIAALRPFAKLDTYKAKD